MGDMGWSGVMGDMGWSGVMGDMGWSGVMGDMGWSGVMGDMGWSGRALCRITLLPVTHVLVDTWMLSVKPVYKPTNVHDDVKWATNTYMTFILTFKA